MHPNACIHITGTTEHIGCTLARNAPRDCAGCSAYYPQLQDEERTRCEVWTRVMGYHRPVSAFNAGKQAEHRERTPFVESAGLG